MNLFCSGRVMKKFIFSTLVFVTVAAPHVYANDPGRSFERPATAEELYRQMFKGQEQSVLDLVKNFFSNVTVTENGYIARVTLVDTRTGAIINEQNGKLAYAEIDTGSKAQTVQMKTAIADELGVIEYEWMVNAKADVIELIFSSQGQTVPTGAIDMSTVKAGEKIVLPMEELNTRLEVEIVSNSVKVEGEKALQAWKDYWKSGAKKPRAEEFHGEMLQSILTNKVLEDFTPPRNASMLESYDSIKLYSTLRSERRTTSKMPELDVWEHSEVLLKKLAEFAMKKLGVSGEKAERLILRKLLKDQDFQNEIILDYIENNGIDADFGRKIELNP